MMTTIRSASDTASKPRLSGWVTNTVGLPRLSSKLYSTKITEGSIGILVHAPADRLDKVASTLR